MSENAQPEQRLSMTFEEFKQWPTHGNLTTTWKTVRIGKQAYDKFNMPITLSLSPWFIKRKEVEDVIASIANDSHQFVRKHILQRMLDTGTVFDE